MNPYISSGEDSSYIVSVNQKAPDDLGDITLPLSDLSDIEIGTVSVGQVLAYNGSKWVNSSSGGGGATALSALTDCTITTPINGQILKYIGSKWVNVIPMPEAIPLSFLSDCIISSPSNGQILKYNGIKWVNATDDDTLATLSDVSFSSPSNGQILQYNGSKWVNAILTSNPIPLSSLSDCAVFTPFNDQILVFSTASLLNKWTPYTLSGVSFNDDTKTISVTGTTKTEIAYTNTVLVPSYTDGVDGHVATFQNYVAQNQYAHVWVLNAFGQTSKATYGHFFNKNGAEDWQDKYGFAYFNRFNVDYIDAIIVSSLSWKLPVEPVNGSGILLRVYGTNDMSEMYSSQSAPLNGSNVTFLATGTLSSSVGSLPVTDINPYRFIILQIVSNSFDHSSFSAGVGPYGFYVTQDFSIHNLSAGTDFNISTSPSNGYPQITYLAPRSGRMTYSTLWLLLYEAYRRLYPVVRDANTIKLTDGTQTVTLTSTSGYPISKCSDCSISNPVDGQVLKYNGTAWVNVGATTSPISYVEFVNDTKITSSSYNLTATPNIVLVDMSNMTSPYNKVHLPNIVGGENGKIIKYFYVWGSLINSNVGIGFDPIGPIYYHNSIWGMGIVLVKGCVYKAIFYESGEAPIAGCIFPCWFVEDASIIPLTTFDVCLLQTIPNCAITVSLQLPTLQEGHQILFKDIGGYLNLSTITLHGNNYNIDGSETAVLNTANVIKKYVYSSALTNLITI